jgi:hypothetical protein
MPDHEGTVEMPAFCPWCQWRALNPQTIYMNLGAR